MSENCQRRYAGGQFCPECGDSLGPADVYCRWCGEQLRERGRDD